MFPFAPASFCRMPIPTFASCVRNEIARSRAGCTANCARLFAVASALLTGTLAWTQASPIALHDGDRVAFYGDSITAQRLYTRFVEDFVLTRYPDLHLTFVNAAVPGDQVSGGYAGTM